MVIALAALFLAAAVLLGTQPPRRLPRRRLAADALSHVERTAQGRGQQRRRLILAALAGAGAFVMVGGSLGAVLGLGAGAATWQVAGRTESGEQRRVRAHRERQLPDVVCLLALALRTGAPVAGALRQVCSVRPGPAAAVLVQVAEALELGVSPRQAWSPLLADPALARLARGLIRAADSGAPVADAVARIGAELATERRMAIADRARTVGVKAALPLGVCLLPAFLLIGIVPLVAASLSTLPR